MLKALLTALGIPVAVFVVWIYVGRYKATHFEGRTAQQWVEALRTDSGPSEDILKPRQVIMPNEKPWVITFEVPIACNELGDHPELHEFGRLALLVDGQFVTANLGDTNNNDCTNGNSLLRWYIDDGTTPGLHQIQVQLLIGGGGGQRLLEARGPIISVRLNNPKW